MKNDTRTPRTILMRGIDALSRREYSRLELYRKLMRGLREGETAQDVEDALDTLTQRGYLSNERYAQGRVRVRQTRYGNMRLAQELHSMGVDSETVREALSQTDDEYERAKSVWDKKFGQKPQDRKERDRQVRFLASRGFSFDIIRQILSVTSDDDFE